MDGVRVLHISICHFRVEIKSGDTMPVVQIVGRVVLAAGRHLQVAAVLTLLHSTDEFHGILRSQVGILSRGFLATTPARICNSFEQECLPR